MTNIQSTSTGSRNSGFEGIDPIDSDRLFNEANSRPRVNWPGVFAGLLAGVTLLVVLGTLGVAFGLSTATSLGNFGTGAII